MTPVELRALYKQGRVIPFVGAGISMSVTWQEDGEERKGPSWRQLVDEAIRLMDVTDPSLLRVRGTDLQIMEYFRIVKGGTAPLTNWLVRSMRPPDAVLRASPIHKALALLDLCSTFYTTNYDDFVERSFRLHGRQFRSIAVEADIARIDQPTVPEIVKFHGDLDHPDHMVLSESDYEERLKLQHAMDYRLRSDLLGRALLFIGYSFSDWNVSYLFRLANEQFAGLPNTLGERRAYITVADPSEFEYRLFSARNIDVIPIRGAHATDDVAEVLNGMRR